MAFDGRRPDRGGLFQLASEQRGYFTTAQARAYGYRRALLAYHARTGTLQRGSTGVYRFRDYPSSPREEVAAAWLAVGKDVAVVSHENALELWGLGDLIPDAVHLRLPRTRHHLPRLPGVAIHTTIRPLDGDQVHALEGVRVTSLQRTLLDVAEASGAPDQVTFAISQASARGWIDRDALRSEAARRGSRVARLIHDALSEDVSLHRAPA